MMDVLNAVRAIRAVWDIAVLVWMMVFRPEVWAEERWDGSGE